MVLLVLWLLRQAFRSLRNAWRRRPGVWRVEQLKVDQPHSTNSSRIEVVAQKGYEKKPPTMHFDEFVDTKDEEFESKIIEARVRVASKVRALNMGERHDRRHKHGRS